MTITFLERIDERSKKTLENIIFNNKLDKTRLMERIQLKFDTHPDIANPSAYLSFILKNINIADYKVVPLSINRIEFACDNWKKRWDDKGFSGDDVTYYLIIRIYEHMVNEFPVTVDEIRELDTKVTDYCVENNLINYSDILNSILRTKTFKKCNVPVEELRKDAIETVELLNCFKERDGKAEDFDPTFSIEDIELMNKLDVDEPEPSV